MTGKQVTRIESALHPLGQKRRQASQARLNLDGLPASPRAPDDPSPVRFTRPRGQLLKWVGSKYRHAQIIASHFPVSFNTYLEPFVGTGAVLATVAPKRGVAGDTLAPLVELWRMIQEVPDTVIEHYTAAVSSYLHNPRDFYRKVRADYNSRPNGLDLLVISRTCYGGVIRFTKRGEISTPIGPHRPISPREFATRAVEWRERTKNVTFVCQPFARTMGLAGRGDLLYCDPPYRDAQTILYGAQSFEFEALLEEIGLAKTRGVSVALSIDGSKKSGTRKIDLDLPPGLFTRELFIASGSSMLRRLQSEGLRMNGEDVQERLLLTW